MKLVGTLAALGVAALSVAQYAGVKPVPRAYKPGFATITEASAKDILTFLAGPDFKGRSPRTYDYMAAAGWVAGELHALGLKPGGDAGSYFQYFTLQDVILLPEETSLTLPDGTVVPYGPQFSCTASEDADGEVQFAFLRAPQGSEPGKLDLRALKGRWLMFNSAEVRAHAAFYADLMANKPYYGFKGVITVVPDGDRKPTPRPDKRVKDAPDPREMPATSITITESIAQRIIAKAGVESYINPNLTIASLETPDAPAKLKTKSKVTGELVTANVVGVLEGDDPVLKSEAVMVGSHLDHVGVRNGQTYFGADDNASGCTANLLMARAFVANPMKPKRSVVFAFYSLEEEGTFGSWAYVSRPAVPMASVIANVNMDMLGRNEEGRGEDPANNTKAVYPGIAKLNSTDLYDLVVANNAYIGLELREDKEDRTDRSDTRNTVLFNIPTLKAFTGEHKDYHRPGDTPDKINWEKFTNIARWLYLCAQDLANRPDKPRFERRRFVAPPPKG